MFDRTNLVHPTFTGVAQCAANRAYAEFEAASAAMARGDIDYANHVAGFGDAELKKAWRYQNAARRASQGPVISGGGNAA